MAKKMYYTEEEAAAKLGCSVDELSQFVTEERIRVFKDGLLSITDALGHTLLTGDVTMLSVEEVEVLGMSFLAGRGQFQVTGGELAGDFQETLGDIVQVSFDLSPTNIDGLSSPFTYVSNVTLTPVPEPGTLALLAIGAAAAVLRRRRLAG